MCNILNNTLLGLGVNWLHILVTPDLLDLAMPLRLHSRLTRTQNPGDMPGLSANHQDGTYSTPLRLGNGLHSTLGCVDESRVLLGTHQ